MPPANDRVCPLCLDPSTASDLQEARWEEPAVIDTLAARHPNWRRSDGACPACVQHTLLEVLLRRGDEGLHEAIQAAWPLDAEAAFGALPTPLRMHADPHYTGNGITLAMVDSGFYPHPDLTRPRNRIRAWVNAAGDRTKEIRFGPDETPGWPEWNALASPQWHGLMTSSVAAGSGWSSHGLYRGLASEADLVLIQVSDGEGHISGRSIVRALEWLLERGPSLGVRVINLSVAGDPVPSPSRSPIDELIAKLVARNITVVAAAGNDGERSLSPPATAPDALTVGGIDDRNTFEHAQLRLWHSNYGTACSGYGKPEVVAPSLWVVAPLLPGTEAATQAAEWFDARRSGDPSADAEIRARRLVRPEYQLVEGTSFAAPIAASVACCMLEANAALSPTDVRRLLMAAASPVAGAPVERQGAGAIDAGQAVAAALRAVHGPLDGHPATPRITGRGVEFVLRRLGAGSVRVVGSWDGWAAPGCDARQTRPGVWQADLPALRPNRYEYKFLVDEAHWLDDPSNRRKSRDGHGGFNSVLVVPGDDVSR